MNTSEINALYYAFACTFTQLVKRGLISGDQKTLDQFWAAFLKDLGRHGDAWTRQLVS